MQFKSIRTKLIVYISALTLLMVLLVQTINILFVQNAFSSLVPTMMESSLKSANMQICEKLSESFAALEATASGTAQLIASNVQSVERGTRVVQKTSSALERMGVLAGDNARAVRKISESSRTQNEAIMVINENIEQISQVVQANSATAQQSAASAEELSAQSSYLNSIAERFRLQ